MKKLKIKYWLVEAETSNQLVSAVNDLLKEGYELHGSMAANYNKFYQPLIKVEDEPQQLND